jgi:O-antigen/teichoic acid export membrane protein
VFWGLGWKGRILAHIFSVLTFSCFSFLILCHNKLIKNGINFSYIQNALKFGVPLLPHSMSSLIVSISDRLLITNLIGITETGLYAVGYQIGQIINILGIAFQNAYIPWLYRKLKSDDPQKKLMIVKLAYSHFLFFFLLALALSIITPWIMEIFIGNEFRGSHIYVIYIALGFSFISMQKVVGPIIYYVEKTYILAYVTALVAIINLILNYIFITKNGSVGAAQATSISYFISFILIWYLSSKMYKMPWKDILRMI